MTSYESGIRVPGAWKSGMVEKYYFILRLTSQLLNFSTPQLRLASHKITLYNLARNMLYYATDKLKLQGDR